MLKIFLIINNLKRMFNRPSGHYTYQVIIQFHTDVRMCRPIIFQNRFIIESGTFNERCENC